MKSPTGPVTVENVLRTWARDWCGLLAWGAPVRLDEMQVGRYNGTAYAGRADCGRHRIIVLQQGHLATDAATVLHELAHLAAPNHEHHGAHWRSLYTRAAAELFGVSVDTFDPSPSLIIGDLDEQIREAAHAWLKRTGQLFTLAFLGVIK